MPSYVDISRKVIEWAVERSGIPADDYRQAVSAWLSGEKKPTYRQLREFARRAMVPFGYLFLDEPPDETLPLPDYRTRQNTAVRRPSPNLLETIFEMQRRQDWMREDLIDKGQESLRFVASASIGDNIPTLADRIRSVLQLESHWAELQTHWEAALRVLRSRIEDAGILIFINGIVGNNTRRKLDPDEFQGFVLVDDVAPLIFVNGADYKVAQMFTIAHELAHVWVGQSALFDLVATESPEVAVEHYCNAVAAEFLVPAELLIQAWPDTVSTAAAVAELARRFKVSPIVVARRAKDERLISAEQFFEFYTRYMNREVVGRETERSGGDFWKTQNTRLGRRFGRAVIAAAHEGRLSYSEAYDLTRLYGDTFDKYARLLDKREA